MSSCYPYFRSFVLKHQAIIRILESNGYRRTKSAAVRICTRCSARSMIRSVSRLPWWSLEPVPDCTVGSVQLLLWRCRSLRPSAVEGSYYIGDQRRSDAVPASFHSPVVYRMGIDLHVNDVRNPEHFCGRSLIWPGNHDRVSMLEHAAEVLKRVRDTVPGRGRTELLPDIVKSIRRRPSFAYFIRMWPIRSRRHPSKSGRIT